MSVHRHVGSFNDPPHCSWTRMLPCREVFSSTRIAQEIDRTWFFFMLRWNPVSLQGRGGTTSAPVHLLRGIQRSIGTKFLVVVIVVIDYSCASRDGSRRGLGYGHWFQRRKWEQVPVERLVVVVYGATVRLAFFLHPLTIDCAHDTRHKSVQSQSVPSHDTNMWPADNNSDTSTLIDRDVAVDCDN